MSKNTYIIDKEEQKDNSYKFDNYGNVLADTIDDLIYDKYIIKLIKEDKKLLKKIQKKGKEINFTQSNKKTNFICLEDNKVSRFYSIRNMNYFCTKQIKKQIPKTDNIENNNNNENNVDNMKRRSSIKNIKKLDLKKRRKRNSSINVKSYRNSTSTPNYFGLYFQDIYPKKRNITKIGLNKIRKPKLENVYYTNTLKRSLLNKKEDDKIRIYLRTLKRYSPSFKVLRDKEKDETKKLNANISSIEFKKVDDFLKSKFMNLKNNLNQRDPRNAKYLSCRDNIISNKSKSKKMMNKREWENWNRKYGMTCMRCIKHLRRDYSDIFPKFINWNFDNFAAINSYFHGDS